MKLDRDLRAEGPVVSGIVRGGFRVDDGIYHGLLIRPDRVDGWTPPAIGALTPEHLASVLAINPLPEFVLLGTGATLVRPPAALVGAVVARGIGVEAMDSRAAARAWGVLRAELRWIVGALYPLG